MEEHEEDNQAQELSQQSFVQALFDKVDLKENKHN